MSQPLGTFFEYPKLFRFDLVRLGFNNKVYTYTYADNRNKAISNFTFIVSQIKFLKTGELPELLVDIDTRDRYDRYKNIIMDNFRRMIADRVVVARLSHMSVAVIRSVDKYNKDELLKCKRKMGAEDYAAAVSKYKQHVKTRPVFEEVPV